MSILRWLLGLSATDKATTALYDDVAILAAKVDALDRRLDIGFKMIEAWTAYADTRISSLECDIDQVP